MIKREIWVTTSFEAMHKWVDCPYEDVTFLRSLHRHIFHVKVWCVVNHSDRDIEFIRLKRYLCDYIGNRFSRQNLGNMSCETIAENILRYLNGLAYKVEVSEDGENGAIVENVDEDKLPKNAA